MAKNGEDRHMTELAELTDDDLWAAVYLAGELVGFVPDKGEGLRLLSEAYRIVEQRAFQPPT